MKLTIIDQFQSRDKNKYLIKIRQIELPDDFLEKLKQEMERLEEKDDTKNH